jgi:hypothetical protein
MLSLGRVETVTSQPLNTKAPRSFETSGDTKPTTLRHVPQDVIFSMEQGYIDGSPAYRALTNLWRDGMGVPTIDVRKRRVSIICNL